MPPGLSWVELGLWWRWNQFHQVVSQQVQSAWTPNHHGTMVRWKFHHGVAKVKKVLTRHYIVTAYAVVAVVVALAPDFVRWRVLTGLDSEIV